MKDITKKKKKSFESVPTKLHQFTIEIRTESNRRIENEFRSVRHDEIVTVQVHLDDTSHSNKKSKPLVASM